jgi:hypothetical protein
MGHLDDLIGVILGVWRDGDVDYEESGEDYEDDDDDEGNPRLALPLISQTRDHGRRLGGVDDHLLPYSPRQSETNLVAGASSLEGVEWLEADKAKYPLEPHSCELLRPTVTIRCRGADVDSGVGDTGNTAGTERILLPLQDTTSHKISHGRTKVRRLRASEQW